jgi:hypothetical protein
MTPGHSTSPCEQAPRLHRDLAAWYPLLTPVSDYAEEAAVCRRPFGSHCSGDDVFLAFRTDAADGATLL